MKKTQEYEVGESLVCRSYFKSKKSNEGKPTTFYKNYEYEIREVGPDSIRLDNNVALPIADIRKHFIHNYCRTCHSFQGLSVDKPITIYDWKCQWASRKWIYTAVTRARQLDQVAFVTYQDKSQQQRQEEELKNKVEIMSYLRRKVEGYKEQDRIADRRINEETYVNAKWLYNCLGKPCQNCGDCLTAYKWMGRLECNLTAQRLNNKLVGHQLDNIVPFCRDCNVAMSNRE